MDSQERQHLEALLQRRRRNLRELEIQAADYGTLHVPITLINEIESEKAEIARLEQLREASLVGSETRIGSELPMRSEARRAYLKTPFVLVIGALLLIIGINVFYLLQYGKAQTSSGVVSTQISVPSTTINTPQLPTQELLPTVTAKQSNITFSSSSAGGNEDIYVMKADGSAITRLTTASDPERNPSWSPDGMHIVYERYVDGNNWEIYTMNADGSQQTNITQNKALDGHPSWSAKGIVFRSDRDGNEDLFSMRADGSGVKQLTFTEGPTSNIFPAWSPNGENIAFASNQDGTYKIYTMSLETPEWKRLTDGPEDRAPDWSPDGSSIVFEKVRGQEVDIYKLDIQSALLTQLTNAPGPDEHPSWSSDGTHIVFSSKREGANNIYTMNSDGSGQRNIMRDYTEAREPDSS